MTQIDLPPFTGSDATETPAEQAPAPAARRRPNLPLVLAGVLVVSLVVLGVVGWNSYGRTHQQASVDAAVAAARTEVPQVLSYDAKTLDADLARSRSLLSGAYAAQFGQMMEKVIKPTVAEQQISTKAETLRAAATDDVTPDHVTVLLFVRQTTSAPSQPQVETGVNQIKATMTSVDGKWLISGLDPL